MAIVALPERAVAGEPLQADTAALLSDAAVFQLTPATAAPRLARFGRLQAEKGEAETRSAEGVALRSFFIALPYGRRAMVFFDRASSRLTNVTLMFDPDDKIDGAQLRASLEKVFGPAQEHAEAGSNRVVWWDVADGRRVRLSLDPPGIEPALVYIASVGRARPGR